MRAWIASLAVLAAILFPPVTQPQVGNPIPLQIRHLGRAPIHLDASAKSPQNEKPLFRFGLIADAQYADKDDRGIRRYREAATKLQECVAELNKHPLHFVVNLGDIIDGNGPASGAELTYILKILNSLRAPVRHVIGNHCLAIDRPELLRKLRLKTSYYTFQKSGWRFLVLDGMDVSLKSSSGSRELDQVWQYLQKNFDLPDYNGAIGDR